MKKTLTLVIIFGVITAAGYAAQSSREQTTATSDALKAMVLEAWQLRLEAGLDRTRGQESEYKKRLGDYFSNQSYTRAHAFPDDAIRPNDADTGEKPAVGAEEFRFASPTDSELVRQLNYIDYGRYNERLGRFKVLGFGIENVEYQDVKMTSSSATVVMDIKWWTEYAFTTPEGGEATTRPHGGQRHTFILAKEQGQWRIVDDSWEILPGYEP